MKKFRGKVFPILAAYALVMTTLISNCTCHYLLHQEPLPENAKKLRKF